MPLECVSGATLRCSMGSLTSLLVVLPVNQVNAGAALAGNILDHVPMVNILPFGLCRSAANPAVAAAGGTPMPCIPVTPTPWVPGSPTVVLGHQRALNDDCTCACTWLGTISVEDAGQFTVNVA